MKPITWLTQKDMAEAIGVSVNTFKKYYRNSIPPDMSRGQRLYWSDRTAQKVIDDLRTNPQLYLNTA